MNTDFITRAYKREAFIDFLSDFLPDDYEPEETEIYTEAGIQRITNAVNLGHVASLDLDVFEFIHESSNDPRVSLTHDAAQIMKKNGNASMALAAFHTDTSKSWRFSLIFYGTKLENGKVKREFSNPRRYSFILGPECKKHTPESMLVGKGAIQSVEDLHSRFAVEVVTKEFYNKLFDWYTWATDEKTGVTFPNNTNIPEDDREGLETKIIRLITRIIFVWFIKQKNLVPENLFEESSLLGILKNFKPQSKNNGDYYNAILQNLFFATLNRAVEDENGNKRGFATAQGTRDVKTLYRYEEMFSIPKPEIIKLFSQIPFLNGGLFECLDKTRTLDGVEAAYNEDGFSRNPATFSNGKPKWRAFVPNILFFDPEKGLFSIFNEYNFTVEENTPYDVDVSLDPELLGKVFENLLGAYNPETQESARKDSGSFYTPREIVNYMVDESLISYLGESARTFVKTGNVNGLGDKDKQSIYEKLRTIKILDPACGSGAFPMGALNRIVDLSKKVSPKETDTYSLKLNLIENCIYGSDIQQIAVQICKLRFFISLICECKKDLRKTNFGINPLPNLETKFVCANSLIALEKNHDNDLFGSDIANIESELQVVRHKHFSAKNVTEKKTLRMEDEKLRKKLAEHLQNDSGYSPKEAKLMAEWNPYDQNTSSPFFDPEWMFGVNDGFDIVIGNPPYISTKGIGAEAKKAYEVEYGFSDDTYNLFTFKGLQLTKKGGTLNYIIPKTFWTTQTKRNMRDLILSRNVKYVFDTANPFEAVMVDTCIVQVENTAYHSNNKITFLDGTENLKEPKIYEPIVQSLYLNALNSIIFKPSERNLKIWGMYGEKVKKLYNTWWEKIDTSKKICKNEAELKRYRDDLKPGDLALLGCLTEGGQGLATANNGKYIAVRKSSKWASNIISSRPTKLAEAIKKNPKIAKELGNLEPSVFLEKLTESQIAQKFDELKEKYGRDIFGKGYIYKLIDDTEIADVDSLTEDEKSNGISTKKKYYVPYDKGDKDGNRWYLETPFAIAWSKENVHFLKTYSGKKGAGMPVVRNPQFNFKEGFCWNNALNPNARLLKAKMKSASVNDVGAMALTTLLKKIPNFYFVCILNSEFIFDYYREFLNCTVNVQINDIRQVPVIIPSDSELQQLMVLFKKAVRLKQSTTNDLASEKTLFNELNEVEKKINDLVEKLYGV